MRQFLLISLFAILLGDVMLGLGLSLAPGLSLKNAMLYVLFSALVLEFLLGNRDPLRQIWPLHGAWALLVFYASFTWLAIVLLGLHRGYESVTSFIILKSQLADLFLFPARVFVWPEGRAKFDQDITSPCRDAGSHQRSNVDRLPEYP